MSSITWDGVRFRVWSHDHAPAHAHGYYASTALVVELGQAGDVSVRPGSKRPANAKKSDVHRIVQAAVAHYAELKRLWEETHGRTQ